MKLQEDTRNQLLNKSKASEKGRERFNKRNRSSVKNLVTAMNQIDMNKLFTDDILSVSIPIKGETDDYSVTVAINNVLELIRDEVQKSNNLTYREITRALINGFNQEDIYVSCNCPDFDYRFRYYASQLGYNSTEPETRPSDITNPKDSLGSSCKHTLLVLNNNSWIQKVSRTLYNYIEYIKKHFPKMYAEKIYPAIYGKEYEEPVQQTFFDADEIADDTEIIDAANKERATSTRFRPGNQSGRQFSRSTNIPANQEVLVNEDDEL